MADLITQARALQVPARANLDTNYLASMISAASAAIESYCDRTFAQATYTEIQDGYDLRWMYLPNTPIASITSGTILLDDQDTISFDSTDVQFDASSGKLQLAPWSDAGYGAWPCGFQRITVVYVGGYDQIPEDVQQACINVVLGMHSTSAKDPSKKSEKLGDYSYTLNTDYSMSGISPMVAQLLANYRTIDTF